MAKDWMFSPKDQKQDKNGVLTNSIQHCDRAIKQENEINIIQIGRKM